LEKLSKSIKGLIESSEEEIEKENLEKVIHELY